MASFSLHARIHKKDNKCQSYMAAAQPATDPFPSICLLGACLAIISNHILTFMPSKNRGDFPFVRHFLKRRHFTNFIKPNEIKMPQTAAWRQWRAEKREQQSSVLECNIPATKLKHNFVLCCILCRAWRSVTLKMICHRNYL